MPFISKPGNIVQAINIHHHIKTSILHPVASMACGFNKEFYLRFQVAIISDPKDYFSDSY